MEHGPLWLQDGEYQRGQARHEELRDDDEDVVYTLAYMQEETERKKDVGVNCLTQGDRFWVERTNQDDPCFRAQVSSFGPACPVLNHVLSKVREIYPAAARVDVPHEALSITVKLCPIILTIIRVFLVRFLLLRSVTSDRHRLVLVWIFFDHKQFVVLSQWAVRAGICEKNRLIIVYVCIAKIGIWRRVNCLGKLLGLLCERLVGDLDKMGQAHQGERRPLRDGPRKSQEGHEYRSATGATR